MSFGRLITRSAWFHWRTNAAVVLAVAVATGVLTGALAVGDSVRFTLRKTLEARLGKVEFAVTPHGRYFRTDLAGDLKSSLGGEVAPVLQVPGMIGNHDGSRRINRVQVLGVDDRFYAMGPGKNPFVGAVGVGVVLSQAVADRLAAAAGDEVLLRIEKTTTMPRDVPLVSDDDRTIGFRLKVRAVADELAFARFDLAANQAAPLNVFVSLAWLAEKIEQPGRANVLLVAGQASDVLPEELNAAVRRVWRPADAGVELIHRETQNALELRSRRVFIEDSLSEEAMKADAGAVGILTYFVNEIRLGENATPYSMVAAVGAGNWIPAGMRDDEIVVNQWLAEDLGAQLGDFVDLTYFVMGPRRKLSEERGRFKIVRIVPLEGAARDSSLMPDFPGLADVDNCRDWKPGVPVDLDKIRPKDERYWDDYRGTPKAFITLEAGRARWRNPYGSLTAIRYLWREGLDRQVAQYLTSHLDPAAAGLFFQAVRESGLQASRGGTDFGQLFLGLSMFLIGSAIILIGLLFVFGVESRSPQIGMLLAVGWPARRVKRLLLVEGGLVATCGAVLGVVAGLFYAWLMLYGLATFWSGAIAGAAIRFHVTKSTLLLGGVGGLGVALLAIWITLRKHVTLPARQLMAGIVEGYAASRSRGRGGIWLSVVSFIGAAILLTLVRGGQGQAMAGAFFGAGALLLLGTLGLGHGLLCLAAGGGGWSLVSLQGLGIRNAARRRGRSLSIIGLLACGVFMVVAVGANRRDPLRQPQSRQSGTGGFALYGESSLGILYDLNTEAGRKELGLTDPELADLKAVPLRVHEGDDASCLNLNRAQRPRLLGVSPDDFIQRGAFKFAAFSEEAAPHDVGWSLLDGESRDGVIPAIGDYPTVVWGLGKKLGDEIEYQDEQGKPFHVRIVAMLDSSILQGSLLISEGQFIRRFPSVDGYRVLLVDATSDKMEAISQKLSLGLTDLGLVLTPTWERLAAFGAVENTYLSIFTALGGLGLILGSVGLGLVVLRNMLERRGELAMLRAIGFERASILRLVFYEHWGLMLGGVVCGVVAAVVAVIPALRSPARQAPYGFLATTLAAIVLSGALWVWLAGKLALQGRLLDALRHE
ncbi:MAG: FtsX-like permease family protein [Phycisphaerae bacterium]|nr:FtsX-like permease family protein [Phycisphaerae bacterium]